MPWGAALLAGALVWAGAASADDSKMTPQLLERASTGAVSVVVEMRDQADLSGAAAIRDKAAKGAFVVSRLKTHAQSTQAPVRSVLEAAGVSYQSYWLANVVHLDAAAPVLRQLAALPGVAAIHAVAKPDFSQAPAPMTPKDEDELEMSIEPGIQLVGAPAVWDLGIRGQGVVVGDHDIGVEWEHPALIRQYRGWDGLNADHSYNWHNAFGALDPFCSDPAVPCDSHGHGTHTTGTMVGDDGAGMRIGMAPEAQWMACRSLLDPVVGVGTLPTYLDCMQWFVAPYPAGEPDMADPSQAPDVINNSWGCVEACPPDILKAANEATEAAGIVQVVSAGNDGQGEDLSCYTLLFPLAIYESSFTVGASDFEDQMASFSSRGPVLSDLSMRTKPDVTAPGVGVLSSTIDGEYAAYSGTSMAGPHVAGLVALLISAEPSLRGQVALIRQIIESTAIPLQTEENCGGTAEGEKSNVFGSGRIDALAAVLAAPGMLDEASGDDSSDEPPQSGGARGDAGVRGGGALGLWLFSLAGLALLGRRRRA